MRSPGVVVEPPLFDRGAVVAQHRARSLGTDGVMRSHIADQLALSDRL